MTTTEPEVAAELAAFALEVGTSDPVTVVGGRTHWDIGGPVAPEARELRAPSGIRDLLPAEMIVRVGAGTTLAELDAEMTMVLPYNQSERCNEEVCDLAEIFADQADYVIAHVPGDGRNDVKWKNSPADKALRYLGASSVNMPEVSDDFQTALDSAEVDLAAALNNPKGLPRFAEVQVSQWLEKASDALEDGSDYLIPDEVGAVALDY